MFCWDVGNVLPQVVPSLEIELRKVSKICVCGLWWPFAVLYSLIYRINHIWIHFMKSMKSAKSNWILIYHKNLTTILVPNYFFNSWPPFFIKHNYSIIIGYMLWVYKLIKVSIVKVANLLGIMKETLYIILHINNEFIYTHKTHNFFLLHHLLFYSCT